MGVARFHRFRRLFHRTALRRATMWIAAAVTLLIVAVWITSWFAAMWVQRNSVPDLCVTRAIASKGVFVLTHVDYRPIGRAVSQQRWQYGFDPHNRQSPHISYHTWWPQFVSDRPTWSFELVLPLWLPTVVFALIAAAAWRLDLLSQRRRRQRRVLLNLCPFCRYDRSGLLSPEAPCPECGKTVDHASALG